MEGAAVGDATEDVFEAKNRLGGIGLVRDPHPRLHELRNECPVHKGSVSGMFGVVGPDNYLTADDEQVSVFTWHEVDAGFRDATTFSNSYVAASLHDGTVTASLLVGRLHAQQRRSRLAATLQDYGRLGLRLTSCRTLPV